MLKVGIFNVRVVLRGDKYGRDDSVTHDGDDPLVEFYDATQDPDRFGDRGQFISRYYCSTIMDRSADVLAVGLNLHGGVPSWQLSGLQAYLQAYLQGFADGRARA